MKTEKRKEKHFLCSNIFFASNFCGFLSYSLIISNWASNLWLIGWMLEIFLQIKIYKKNGTDIRQWWWKSSLNSKNYSFMVVWDIILLIQSKTRIPCSSQNISKTLIKFYAQLKPDGSCKKEKIERRQWNIFSHFLSIIDYSMTGRLFTFDWMIQILGTKALCRNNWNVEYWKFDSIFHSKFSLVFSLCYSILKFYLHQIQ